MPFGPLARLPIFGKRRNQPSPEATSHGEPQERKSAPMTHAVDTAQNEREREVLQALSTIQNPDLHPDIVGLNSIASGTGGFGTSTTSVNLAMALTLTGAKLVLFRARQLWAQYRADGGSQRGPCRGD